MSYPEEAMSILIADEQFIAKLDRADWPVEICTHDGRRLGFFTPAKPVKHNLEPRISEEEIQRRLAEPDSESFTAAQVEARIRELRCSR
jgi:hypothetical protein